MGVVTHSPPSVGGAWDALPDREKREKEVFLLGEQRAAKGFMGQASLQLELFHSITQTDPVTLCLHTPELARRTTATVSVWVVRVWPVSVCGEGVDCECVWVVRVWTVSVWVDGVTPLPQLLGFLETLCGPKSSELKVRDMDHYSFKPRTLVSQIASVLVRAWTLEEGQRSTHHILEGVAEYPEYSASTMSKCGGILGKEDGQLAAAFSQLVQQVHSVE